MPDRKAFIYTVPEGWQTEMRNADESVLSSPSGYHVTLDWDDRKARPGITTHGKAINKTEYKGRGWQQRMVADAIAYLQALEATKPR